LIAAGTPRENATICIRPRNTETAITVNRRVFGVSGMKK
jgi:hypothetical protein